MSAGMRPQDERVFADAATKFQVWLIVRQTNPASWKYIGLTHYFPKPITCKPKTADLDAFPGSGMPRARYDTAGLVVDPTIHKAVFSGDKTAKALGLWTDFKAEYLTAAGANDKSSDYRVDTDKQSRHYGCLQYKGKYLHGDYDLYDIIATVGGQERANLAVVGTRDGVADYRPAHLFPIEDFVNGRIGAEMVHHGGQFQFSEHTNDTVEIFGPRGEREVAPAASWYAKHFPHRRAPGPAGGFAVMKKV
jgi:hypothetical protein